MIRDPRFQVRSRSKLSSFKCESGDIPGYCRSVEDDITLGSQLSPALYRLVRYEDLTREPLTVLTALYQFIGVDMTNTISDRIKLHFHSENMSRPVREPIKMEIWNYGIEISIIFYLFSFDGFPQYRTAGNIQTERL